jgi:MarR family 2-MHQ and catechol resistance regulon transcriptional repressor
MPSHYDGTKSEVRALSTFIKLMRAMESVNARLTAKMAHQTELTITQFGVLEALHHLGPMCQKEIAHKQLKSGGNITMVIDNLEKRKLVRRVRNEEDRRFITVYLTGDGETLIGSYFPEHARAIEKEMSVLSAKEQNELGRLCKKLGVRMSASEKEAVM